MMLSVHKYLIQFNYILPILIVMIVINLNCLVQSCLKSSMYYRSNSRGRSHIFLPGEYQPVQMENTVEASGPLDARDFQHDIPSKKLVRVDSPHIQFANEAARWMTKGCRDRLIKLSTQIQNTWAKQEVRLRVMRSWVKPPPNYKPVPVDTDQDSTTSKDSTLLFDETNNLHNIIGGRGGRNDKIYVEPPPTVFSGQRSSNTFMPANARVYPNAPIIDMTPEMMDDQLIDATPTNNRKEKQSTGLKFVHHTNQLNQQYYKWPNNKAYSPYVIPFDSKHPFYDRRSLRFGNSYNPIKLTQSNHMRKTMIRVLRHVGQTNLTKTITKHERPTKLTHKIVERSVNTMHAPSIIDKRHQLPLNLMPTISGTKSMLNDLRMEEFHYAGRGIDIELVTRNYASPPNAELYLGVLAQIAYYVAHFDWCLLSRAGYVHCSVKPDSIVTSHWFGCFPGSATLLKENGEILDMRDARIGDQVMTVNLHTGKLESTEIIAFLDRDIHGWSPMLEIFYEYTEHNARTNELYIRRNNIILTYDHLIYVLDNLNSTNPRAVFASSVQLGQYINIVSVSRQLAKIVYIHKLIPTINDTLKMDQTIGLYAPLTQTGTILINNVLVSCFAYIYNDLFAYLVTWPLNIFHSVTCLISDSQNYYNQLLKYLNLSTSSSSSASSQLPLSTSSLQLKEDGVQNGVHGFVQWIYDMTVDIIPSSFFHKTPNHLLH